jgi:hypothetical protein
MDSFVVDEVPSPSCTDAGSYTYEPYETCYGCGGKGWVNTRAGADRCPVCLGNGYVAKDPLRPKKYEVIITCG